MFSIENFKIISNLGPFQRMLRMTKRELLALLLLTTIRLFFIANFVVTSESLSFFRGVVYKFHFRVNNSN